MTLPDYHLLGPGHYSLIIEGKSHEVFVREEKGGFVVEIDGHLIPVRAKKGDTAAGPVEEETGSATIVSPMPGRVVGLRVKPGDSVKAGQGLIIIEAMKMENELKAPKSGIVAKVSVTVGMAVESGQELVVIE